MLVPDVLAQVMPEELGRCSRLARASLRPGGWLAVTVPNGEVLDNPCRCARRAACCFTRTSSCAGSPAAPCAVAGARGVRRSRRCSRRSPTSPGSGRSSIAGWMALASEPRLHFGNGGMLLAIAACPTAARTGDAEIGARWLASRARGGRDDADARVVRMGVDRRAGRRLLDAAGGDAA